MKESGIDVLGQTTYENEFYVHTRFRKVVLNPTTRARRRLTGNNRTGSSASGRNDNGGPRRLGTADARTARERGSRVVPGGRETGSPRTGTVGIRSDRYTYY